VCLLFVVDEEILYIGFSFLSILQIILIDFYGCPFLNFNYSFEADREYWLAK